MSDPGKVNDFQGPRLPSEESRESEIDPEKFRRVARVEESDESQKKKKRRPTEEAEEAEEEEAAETKAPTKDFAAFMDDRPSDSEYNVGKASQNVRRSQGESPENTQMYSRPKSSYGSQFPGRDQGEEVGDELFNELGEAPPEYSMQEEEPPLLNQAPQAEKTSEMPPVNDAENQPPLSPVSQEDSDIPSSESHTPKEVSSKQTSEKTPDQTQKEPKGRQKTPRKQQKSEEILPLELESEVIKEPKTPQEAPKSSHIEEKLPSKHTQTKSQKKQPKQSPPQAPYIEESQAKPVEEFKSSSSDSSKKQQSPPEDNKEPSLQDRAQKPSEKKSAPPEELEALGANQALPLQKQSPSLHEDEKEDVGVHAKQSSSKSSSKKRSISQPNTPVIYDEEGKLITHAMHEHHDDDNDQQQQSMQIDSLTPMQGAQQAQAIAYSKLSPEVFGLFEKMVGLMTIESTKGMSKTTVTLQMPNSVFNGSKIILDHFDTAPHSFNLQLQGSDEAVKMFNANMNELAAAFQGSRLAFEVNIKRPELLPRHRATFERKSTDYDSGPDSNE